MQTPALEQLMGAYFHQDFHDDYGDIWGTVDAFTAEEPKLASALPDEIAQVLARFPLEAEVDSYLESLGSSVYLDQADGGYRGWLREMSDRIEKAHQPME